MTMLHTWGSTLTFHPHVHALVTAGGWDGASWRPIRNGYLLPGRVLAALFRGKVIAALRRALERGELVLPEGSSRVRFENRLRTIELQRFGVHIAPPLGHSARGILLYLGHYLRGCPIRNPLPSSRGRKLNIAMQQPSLSSRRVTATPHSPSSMVSCGSTEIGCDGI